MKKRYLSTNIMYLKNEKGLTRIKLSYLAQASVEIISNIEKEITSNPNLVTISKIAKGLEISVEDLLYKDLRKEGNSYEPSKIDMEINSNNWFLSTNINNYINSKSMTVIEFCKASKLSFYTISYFLKGKKKSVRLEIGEKIATIIDVTMDQLLFEEIEFN